PHIVYERDGNIYYKCGLGNEELVASGRRPAIAVGLDGMPRVAFIGSTSGNYLTARIGGLWQTPVNVSTSSGEIDIDVDNNNHTHIVYVADTLSDGYVDVVYANDAGGVFVSEVIWNGFYWYESGGKTGRYYDNPRIKIDSTGAYHIVATHHALDGGLGWTEHAYYVVYKSNSSEAISPYRGNVGV
ncbi:MAG: hypothetical protein NUV31_10010, partial [Dehalococcoidales bacterium]|nr:hypothetical protein [Dehalococcoidales bacterium]